MGRLLSHGLRPLFTAALEDSFLQLIRLFWGEPARAVLH